MSSPLPAPSDPGLQPERTALAWTRTACSMAVVGLLGLRWAGPFGSLFLIVALVACGCVLLVLARGRARFRRQAHSLLDAASSPPAPGSPAAVGAGAGGTAAVVPTGRMASASVLAMVGSVMALGLVAAVVVAAV